MAEKPSFDPSEEPTIVPEPQKTEQKNLETMMVRERNTIVPPINERVSEEKIDEFARTIHELLARAAFLQTKAGVDISDFYRALGYYIAKRHLDVFAHVAKPSDIEIHLPEQSPEFDMTAPMLLITTPNSEITVSQREVVAVQLTLKKTV